MKEKSHIQEELEGLSPKLAQMKAEGIQPFRVPEGYFEGLPGDVLRRIRAEEGLAREEAPAAQPGWPERIRQALHILLRPRYAVGLASAAVLVAVGLYFFWPARTAEPVQPLANLSQEEIAAFITTNIESFDIDMMVEASVISNEDVPGVDLFQSLDDKDLGRYLDQYLEDMSLEELDELL